MSARTVLLGLLCVAGRDANQPTEPARVLQRRFGDCKDKVMLLVTLLHAMSIDAKPALVNTWLQHETAGLLPNPGAFDHAIVRIRHDGATYWLDPTRALQGGLLQTMAQARYGAALVIEPGVNSLEQIPGENPQEPTTEVTETFNLQAGVSAKAVMTVTTIYRGGDADRMRRELQASTSAEISRGYLDFYRDWYPGIRQSSDLKSSDNRDANYIEITEGYEIEPAFDEEDDGSLRFDLNPHVVTSRAAAPKLTRRSTPLEVRHPINVRYKAVVQLPEAWPATTGVVTIEDPAFHYRSDLKYSKQTLDAQYEFRTLADHVDADRAPEYARKLEQVRDDASYWFTHPGRARLPVPESINLAILLAVAAGLGAGALLILLIGRQVPGSGARSIPAGAPAGIGGWLLLPALHTCILPVALGIGLFAYWPFLNAHTWNEIGAGASELAIQSLKLGFFALVCIGSTLFAGSIYAIYLLFSRRCTYPFTYILLTWGVVARAVIDLLRSTCRATTGLRLCSRSVR